MAFFSLSCPQLLPQLCPSSGAFYSWISQLAILLRKPLYLKDNSSVCPTDAPFPDMLQLFREGIILSCPERFQVTTGLVRNPGTICPPPPGEGGLAYCTGTCPRMSSAVPLFLIPGFLAADGFVGTYCLCSCRSMVWADCINPLFSCSWDF